MSLPDSTQREVLPTGAHKDPSRKLARFDLISPYALRRLANHYGRGAEKYSDRDWEAGMPVSMLFSSAIGHLYRWLAGYRDDEDHLAAALWNISAIMHFEATHPDMLEGIPTTPTNPGGADI